MKRLLLSAGLLVSVFAMTAAQQRIPIQDDKPVELYALGANSTMGVYKFTLTDLSNPNKISGTTYTSYTGSNGGGGGTFLSSEKVVGVKYNYGAYPFEATAEGTADGPWAASYYAGSYYIDKVYDMTYDEKNDIIYCWYGLNAYNNVLGIYDPGNHTVTRVGSAGNTAIYALAIDNDGQLWGVGNYGLFYSIDKTTGKATEVTGSMGCGIQLQSTIPASAAVDPASNMMYVVAKTGTYDTFSTLNKIDLTTYKGQKVGNLDKYYNCLYIAGSNINENAPAMVEDLTATFDGEATVVSFTAPSQTAGGKALSGDLTYIIKVDGEESATGTVAAGAQATVKINPATGKHEIQVSVSNDAGESKGAKTTVFSGYDEPTAVGDLKAEANGNEVKLTWAAPTGKNGGMLDMAKIRYAVSVDGKTVASDLTATEYTCTADGFYAMHTYQVTVVNGGTDGESLATTAMAGNPYEVPFTLDLADFDSLGAAGITVINLDGGNSGKWELVKSDEGTYLESYSTPVFTRKDYAYLPYASLKAGVSYTFTFKAAARTTLQYGLDKPVDMRVVIASEPTGDSEAYTQLAQDSLTSSLNEYVWNDYTVAFTVEKDGDYVLGLLDYAANIYSGYHYLEAKDFAVTANYHTPEAVTELAAQLQADNNRNVDLSFVLPTKDTEGEDLTALTKIEIYRGEELIKTFEGTFTPGEAMSYTDEEAPRGVTEYSVTVYNGEQVSAPATVSVAVGYAANLQIALVSAPESAVEPNGAGVITVKVTNDGYEAVADGAYDVVLTANGEQAAKLAGKALEEDASAEYSFTLMWDEATPATVNYVAKVEFSADANTADNATGAIEVNFATGAPKAVENLNVTAQANNNRNIDITFNLPTKDVAGANLTSINKVEIFRGTELIKTFEGTLTPGEFIGYTDENAPRGIRNYKVIVYNGDHASAATSASVRVGYVNNLQIETVFVPNPNEEIDPDGKGSITVKVTNDGFEKVLYGAYEVALFCNGEKVASQIGETIGTDESLEYYFVLNWTGETPITVEYTVQVLFDGDENKTDNTTAPIPVSFRKYNSIDEIASDGITIGAAGGSITVKGAAGSLVRVFTVQGQTVVSEIADDEYATPALPAGVYIVTAGNTTAKIAL